MRLRLKRTIYTILVFGAMTTCILHFRVSENRTEELDDTGENLQQVHRRAAGVVSASVPDKVEDKPVGDDTPQDGGLLQLEKESRGKLREMAWANGPSLSEDESHVVSNSSVPEFQLKLRPIEIEFNQFALELQRTRPNPLGSGGKDSINAEILQPAQNITIVVKDAPSPRYIHVAAETAAKLQQLNPPLEGSNFRKTELNDIFIAVKTTGKYHKSRLGILIDTWVTQAQDQVSSSSRTFIVQSFNINVLCD